MVTGTVSYFRCGRLDLSLASDLRRLPRSTLLCNGGTSPHTNRWDSHHIQNTWWADLIAAMINRVAMGRRLDAVCEKLRPPAREAHKCNGVMTYSHASWARQKLFNGAGFTEAQQSLTDLHDCVVQGPGGDSHQSGKRIVQLQNQVDRSRNRQGAHDQGSDYGWVPGCEEAEAGKDDG